MTEMKIVEFVKRPLAVRESIRVSAKRNWLDRLLNRSEKVCLAPGRVTFSPMVVRASGYQMNTKYDLLLFIDHEYEPVTAYNLFGVTPVEETEDGVKCTIDSFSLESVRIK